MHHPQGLPVENYRDQILATVSQNPTTIITAETGAGKSTMIPCFLYEAGYKVIVTQPRILATKTVAARVADVLQVTLGGVVGYHTGEGRKCTPTTDILFCTDGLQLVRELAGHAAAGGKTILVLDEVHEWNTNMEVLVAWSRSRQEAGDDLKVVLMSATIEAEELSKFFGGAPVITVPGRTYPVTRSVEPADNLENAVVQMAMMGRNVLVFQPGKKEIRETVDALTSRLGSKADVLPLHGEVDPADQMRCFAPVPKGLVKVVVATNVAQTSVTIPDIDAVVDSGMERRIELRDGIEGLHLLPISLADCDQRAGRAGRTKPGAYVLASDVYRADRPLFPKAEILRTRLDQMVLRLACQGFDATELRFFHQPDQTALAAAKQSLITLGAMHPDGSVTGIGRKMSRLPLAVTLARMLVEAERLGVTEQVATVAACLEAGNILTKDGKWANLTTERKSDLLATLDVFRAGQAAIKTPSKTPKIERLKELGIFAKDFFRACELRVKILQTCSSAPQNAPKDVRAAVLQACVAGLIEHLHIRKSGYYVGGGNPTPRILAKESVVRTSPEMVVGVPFDISGKDKRGRPFQLRLVGMVTAMDVASIERIAPHLITRVPGKDPIYDYVLDCIQASTERVIAGQVIERVTEDCPRHPEGPAVFAKWLCDVMHNDYMGVPSRLAEVVEANRKTLQKIRNVMWSTQGAITAFSHESDVLSWLLTQLPEGCASAQAVLNPNSLILPVDRELERQTMFRAWKYGGRRDPLFDPHASDEIPALQVEVYGHDKHTGEPLMAYGAMSRDYSGKGQTTWSLNQASAQETHSNYVRGLLEQRAMAALTPIWEGLMNEALTLSRLPQYHSIPDNVRREIEGFRYRKAYSAEQTQRQIEEIRALIDTARKVVNIPVVRAGNLDMSGLAAMGLLRQRRK